MKKLLVLLLSFSCSILAQQVQSRIDPPNWWAGMKTTTLQLMIHATNIGNCKVSSNNQDFKIVSQKKLDNSDFLFVDVVLSATIIPCNIQLIAENTATKKNDYFFSYEIKQRRTDGITPKGLSSADLIYLLMPDRFSNGDEKNDVVSGTNQTTLNRDSMFLRHGGDLQGVMNHLDYISDLGTTALWLNPVQENNQPKESYHGYAITDHYKIDTRLGTNELYKKLTDEVHQKGMKMIMDVVPNHCGNEHYFIKSMPSKDWVHQWNGFTRTSYRAPTLLDPYASNFDKNIFSNAWFDKHMPDLNQQNIHVANYLIQNTLWWIEYAGIDALRIDTYAYPDQDFMNHYLETIFNEFPTLGVFGEIWDHGVAIQSFYTKNNLKSGKSLLPGVTDFQLNYAIVEALTKSFGWTEGASRIYYTLAQDYLYSDASKNVIFLDNHDVSRFYSMVNEDIEKFKMGITFLLTTRGIPMLYYGTEILMKNYANPDGKVREDFVGGWKNDIASKFVTEGRTEKENLAYNYIKKLALYRKKNPALINGKLTQFVPEKGVYVYFRSDNKNMVMVVLNTNETAMDIELNRFREFIAAKKEMYDVINNKPMEISPTLHLEKNSSVVIELK